MTQLHESMFSSYVRMYPIPDAVVCFQQPATRPKCRPYESISALNSNIMVSATSFSDDEPEIEFSKIIGQPACLCTQPTWVCADMKAQSTPVIFQLQSGQKPSRSLVAANSNRRAGFIDERDLIIDSSHLSRSSQREASLSLLMFFVIIVATIALLLELMPTAWDALEKLQVI